MASAPPEKCSLCLTLSWVFNLGCSHLKDGTSLGPALPAQLNKPWGCLTSIPTRGFCTQHTAVRGLGLRAMGLERVEEGGGLSLERGQLCWRRGMGGDGEMAWVCGGSREAHRSVTGAGSACVSWGLNLGTISQLYGATSGAQAPHRHWGIQGTGWPTGPHSSPAHSSAVAVGAL